MQRGEVWQVRLPIATAHEQSGVRPAVVIQDELYGQGSPLVLVVLLTSQLAAERFPGSIRVEPTVRNGLTTSSIAMVFQTRALDRTRFARRMGELERHTLDALLDELERLTGRAPAANSKRGTPEQI